MSEFFLNVFQINATTGYLFDINIQENFLTQSGRKLIHTTFYAILERFVASCYWIKSSEWLIFDLEKYLSNTLVFNLG